MELRERERERERAQSARSNDISARGLACSTALTPAEGDIESDLHGAVLRSPVPRANCSNMQEEAGCDSHSTYAECLFWLL